MRVRTTIHDSNNFGIGGYKLQMNFSGWVGGCVL